MDDSIFAEIEIKTKTTQGEISPVSFPLPFSTAPPPEPIKPRIIDPIREKFYEMRKLASAKPFARSDSELFYRQARFMEDFTDDYEGDAKFNMYFPYYQNMGYEYLRTYFSWRTKTRAGDLQPTSLSYIFLYLYEILSGIGVKDSSDGLEKLLEVWNAFSKENTTIEKYLPKWFKDYHIYYELPHSFTEFIEKHKLHNNFSLILLFDENVENKLLLWNRVSGYDITASKYYKDGNEQILCDCFAAVLERIQEFCVKRKTRFEDLLVYSVSRRTPWVPFKQALFGSRASQNDREIKISDFERYFCKNGQWTANLPIYYSTQKDFVGYVIKKTEACLRQVTNYKYKLVADMKSGSKPFRELQRPAAKRAELDKVIEKAVADFYADLNRTVVKVDHTNLARIRSEALETQGQLIVPEEKTEEPSPCLPPEEAPVTLSFADGWKALKSALTDVEREALSLALQDGADVKAFADEKRLMLEVLADSINEKAADLIGDNLLELEITDEITLYDEYRDNIANLCR